MPVLILSVGIALFVSFMCSLLEACLLSLSMTDIAHISEKRPFVATIWKGLKENIQKPIAVILIMNTLAMTIGAAVSGAKFNELFGSKWVAVYSIALSLIMIQWTEMLPKTLGVKYNRLLAVWVALPLRNAVQVLFPVVSVMEWLNRPFHGSAKIGRDSLSEISVLARFAALNKEITQEQQDIVSRSIKLSNAAVRDIMVDRNEIKYLSTSMTMIDALIEAHLHHHTRYVLIQENDLDKVLGYVNVKDIVSALQTNPTNPSLAGIARPVLDVGVGQKVPAILTQLTKGYQHIAVVKDEKGQTAGLVTMEDIVEAIVGDIEDEYDVLPSYVHKLADVRFLAGGGVTLPRLKEITGFNVPDLPIPVSEWMCQQLQKTPVVETKVPYGDVLFIVRKVRRSKIHEVIVEKRQQIERAAAEALKGA